MAFIRQYSEQGDAISRVREHFKLAQRPTLRAGRLAPRTLAQVSPRWRLTPRGSLSKVRGRLVRHPATPVSRVALSMYAGDPFFKGLGKWAKRAFKPPKAIRKLTLGKVVGGIAKAAQFAAPFVPFVGGAVGSLLSKGLGAAQTVTDLHSMFAPGGGPESPPPELVLEPDRTGTVSEAAEPYYVPGIEVSAPRRGRGPVYYDEYEYEPEDELVYEPEYEDDELTYDDEDEYEEEF